VPGGCLAPPHALGRTGLIIVNNERMDALVLFDLDNTLLDRQGAFVLWASGFIASNNLDHDALAVIVRADADGAAPREDFFSELRGELGIKTEVDQLLADYYREYPSKFSVQPETIAGVRLLRASGFKVGVVTNGPPSQWRKLEAVDMASEFDVVCISVVVGSWKPDLPIFTAAARACEVALEGWMVGDSPQADIVGGANAGLKTIWMARGRNWTLDDLTPDHIVDSIPQAVEVILTSE
jgi:FMN phosphatase YigB (HAD superfamily)